jgi:glycosyltransferase involved in cell wall biosynthesis
MKITIITVSFNAAETIGDTLRSVAAQTYEDIEHILIDGASKDATVAVAKDHGGHLAKFISEPDRGIYDAMNKGIALATGDIIGFLNADDIYASPNALETIVKAFTAPEVDACYGDLLYVRKNDPSSIVRYWQSSDYVNGAFRKGWCPPHPTFFVRRKIYEQYRGFNLDYKIAADVEIMFRLLEVNGIKSVHIPETIVKMRTGGESNKSVGNIILQNREIVRFINENKARKMSVASFLAHKLLSRMMQFVRRPRPQIPMER